MTNYRELIKDLTARQEISYQIIFKPSKTSIKHKKVRRVDNTKHG